MKWLTIIVCLISLNAIGQGWRDTLSLAREAYKNKNYEDALSYYESAQRTAPEGVNLSDEMAQSAYKAREFEKAEKIYQQNQPSKKTSKEKAEAQHNLGNSRMKQKNYQGAIEAYKESLRNNPNDEETRYNLSEAIRQLKEEQKQDQKNQNNSDQNDQNDQNDQGKQNNQNQNQNGDQNQNNNGNDQPNDSNNGEKSNHQGSLQNKTVERLLDQLMKDEAETKRKMAGTEKGNSSSKSGKDW